MILKLECLLYLNIYILFYIRRAILTQTNSKKSLIKKKQAIFKKVYFKNGN